MFGKKVEQAKSDWPIDSVNVQKRHVDISGDYVTPGMPGTVLVVAMLVALPLGFLTAGIGLFFLIPGVPAIWMLMKKKLRIRIDDDTVRLGGKRYQRNPDLIEFRVDRHQRAFRDNPGEYRTALEVVMQYGERRIPVAEMRQKDSELAVALQHRLHGWCHGFEKIMASYEAADATPVRPEATAGEFGPAPDVR